MEDTTPKIVSLQPRSALACLGAAGALLLTVPAEAPAAFNAPVVVTGEDTAEPGIDIAADGTIYVNAPAGLLSNLPGSASFLFRSDDGGATWVQTDPGLRENLPGGGDSDVALDPADGTIYFTDLYLANSTVSVSHDEGNTWAFVDPVGGAPVHDRQWLATSGGGNVYHVYNQIPTGLWVSKSVDGGMTYVLGTLAASVLDRTGCVCPPGNMVAENGGLLGTTTKVGVIYANSTGGIGFARSTNGGITWTQHVISPSDSADDTTLAFPVVARAGTGQLKAVWMEQVGNRTRVQFSRSSDFGQNWSVPLTLAGLGSAAGGTPVFPWIDARNGKVSIVLYHNAAEATPGSVPEGSEWLTTYFESLNGGSTFSGMSQVDSTPVKTGPICTEGVNCSEDRELLDFLQVAIDPQSRANVAWTRSIDGASDTEIRFARQP